MGNSDEPRGCTNLKLRQLTRLVSRHYEHHFAELGLRNTQYALLSFLVELGPVRPVDLARHMQVDPSTLTRNLQPLTAQGLVKIGEGQDARSRLVEITPAGQVKRAEAMQAWRAAQASLDDVLGIERVAALHDMLDASMELLGGSSDQNSDR